MPLSRSPRAFAASMCLAGFAAVLAAQPVAVYPDYTNSLSLNGTWDFAYRAGPAAEHAPVEFRPITVPGHWELQGFAEPKYGKELAEGNGYYRLTFPVPTAWAGQRVMLRFDGVLSGFTAAVNGKPIGEWASGYNPATFDITDLLLAGGRNELTLTVTTRSHGWEFDTNDCWSLSGIYRDVTLFAVPAAHLQHYTARTTLAADGSATLVVNTQLCAPAEVTGRLLGPDGKLAAKFEFGSDKATVGEARVALPQ